MSVSRRLFVKSLSAGGVGMLAAPLIAARGREGSVQRSLYTLSDTLRIKRHSATDTVRIDSNENPNGPGAAAIDAMRAAFDNSNRYPDVPEDALVHAIAKLHGVAPEQVIMAAAPPSCCTWRCSPSRRDRRQWAWSPPRRRSRRSLRWHW